MKNCKDFVPTLILTQNFLPARGGTITWMLNTYSRYQPNEAVIVTEPCEQGIEIDKGLSFPVERIPMEFGGWDPTEWNTFRGYLRAIRKVGSLVKQYGIQQIHVARVLPEGLVALLVCFLQKIPYVMYAHGEEVQTGLLSRKFAWLMPKIFTHATVIIANSENTKQILQNVGVQPEKIKIIHPGVDTEVFAPRQTKGQEIRDRHQLGRSPVLLTVGRLQRRKGHDMVLKALPSIKDSFPSVMYLIVGDGKENTYLQRLAADLGVAESVIFVGEVADEELADYFSACDLFIMPNRQIKNDIEGFGIVYLEAGAMGKPVIGGKSGGTKDAILDGVTGFRVDGANTEEIAEKVKDLLSDPTKAQLMGSNGRNRVLNEFTWEQVYKKTRVLTGAIS